ncbi:hypothetical protein WDU94_009283 [Cyamophila willieti]
MGFSASDEIQESTVTLSHPHRKSFQLHQNATTKMFVTKDNRHEYDFLYSEQNCHFEPKQKVSFDRDIHLKNILATFDSEDGGMVADVREGDSELREPTLPENMFDELEFESVHDSEPQNVHLSVPHKEENDLGTVSQIENSESLEKSIRLEKNSLKPLGITKEKGDYDFLFSDFNVKPFQRNAKNVSVKVEDLRNVVNLFNSDDGGFVPIGKKSEEESSENEPTLPPILMGSEDLHVSRDSGSREESKSNFQLPRDDESEYINSDVTETAGSSNVYHKKIYKTDTVNNEYVCLKQEHVNDEFENNLAHQRQNPIGINKMSTANDIDAIVNDFIAAQRKYTISTIRPITQYIKESLEETSEKYTFGKRKGRTKTTTNKKTVPRSTKRRGRPRKSTVSSTTRETPQISLSTRTSLPTTKTCTRPTLEKFMVKPFTTTGKPKTIETTGLHNRNKNTNIFNQISPRNDIKLDFLASSLKGSTIKILSKPSETPRNESIAVSIRRKLNTISSEKGNTRTSFKVLEIKCNSTEKNLAHSYSIKFERPLKIKSSEFVEESFFTVVPILDSNMYTGFEEFHYKKHKVKTTTPASMSFKSFNDRLLYIKDLFRNDGLVTAKRLCKNVSFFNVNEGHVNFGTYNNGINNLSETSLIEVEEVPIVDFKDPLRIIEHKRRQSQHPWNFKIGSWNVNGIRAWAKKDGFSFIKDHDLNAFCIQEIRCPLEKIPKCPTGYHDIWFPGTKQGYAGVAILSKTKPLSITKGFILSNEDLTTDGIDDGRVITVEYEEFYLVNVYAPASKQDLSMLHMKLKWNSFLHDHLQRLNQMKPVVLAGDFNVAHEFIDVALPLTNLGKSCFTREERDCFSKFLSLGFVDTYRHLYPSQRTYTYWPYYDRPSKLNGWRLDYFLISSQLVHRLSDQEIHCDVEGSDHSPQILYLNI